MLRRELDPKERTAFDHSPWSYQLAVIVMVGAAFLIGIGQCAGHVDRVRKHERRIDHLEQRLSSCPAPRVELAP